MTTMTTATRNRGTLRVRTRSDGTQAYQVTGLGPAATFDTKEEAERYRNEVGAVRLKAGFRLDRPHRESCPLADDPEAFVVLDGMDWRSQGSRSGKTAFYRFGCNDPDCPAVLAVRAALLIDFLADRFEQPRP